MQNDVNPASQNHKEDTQIPPLQTSGTFHNGSPPPQADVDIMQDDSWKLPHVPIDFFRHHSTDAPPSVPPLYSTLSKFYDNQVLLGLVVLSNSPKPSAPLLVNQLLSSGVRFVHFCTAQEKTTHNLGEKLGLFTGFNHYISLRPPEVSSEHELFLGTSRLPRGMRSLRHHLKYIDNIPLLVSLFSDSTDAAVAEYLRVAYESHERVVSLTSSYASDLLESSLLADLVITQQPTVRESCIYNDWGYVLFLVIVSISFVFLSLVIHALHFVFSVGLSLIVGVYSIFIILMSTSFHLSAPPTLPLPSSLYPYHYGVTIF